SAALMISPMPFLGPVGAVRIGRNEDGNLVVNPTLQEAQDSALDLVVVGTKEGLTMVEAGADQIPEDTILEALALAQSEIIKLWGGQGDLQRQIGKPKWLDLDLSAELESQHGHTVWERIQSAGLKDAGAVVDDLVGELTPPLSMESTDEDITRQMQV